MSRCFFISLSTLSSPSNATSNGSSQSKLTLRTIKTNEMVGSGGWEDVVLEDRHCSEVPFPVSFWCCEMPDSVRFCWYKIYCSFICISNWPLRCYAFLFLLHIFSLTDYRYLDYFFAFWSTSVTQVVRATDVMLNLQYSIGITLFNWNKHC